MLCALPTRYDAGVEGDEGVCLIGGIRLMGWVSLRHIWLQGNVPHKELSLARYGGDGESFVCVCFAFPNF